MFSSHAKEQPLEYRKRLMADTRRVKAHSPTPGWMDRQRHNVRSQTLARAADIVGGPESLRRRLNISALLLAVWISGAEPLPTDVFLKAVDIVEQEMVESLKNGRTAKK